MITCTQPQIRKVLDKKYHGALNRFEKKNKLSMADLQERGLEFALACLPAFAPEHLSNTRMFAYDCIELVRPGYRRSKYRTEISNSFQTRDKLIEAFDLVSETVYNHAMGNATDSDLKRVVAMLDVPHSSHKHHNKMMVLGYALQTDILKNIGNIYYYVEEDARTERAGRVSYAQMSLSLQKRF